MAQCCWCGGPWTQVITLDTDVSVTVCAGCATEVLAAMVTPESQFMKEPGRNDPCLCGSGLKWKKCCEGKSIVEIDKETVYAMLADKLD